MARPLPKFTQADIARTLRAVAQVGVDVEVILQPDGSIRITKPQAAAPAQTEDVYEFIRL